MSTSTPYTKAKFENDLKGLVKEVGEKDYKGQ